MQLKDKTRERANKGALAEFKTACAVRAHVLIRPVIKQLNVGILNFKL